MTPFRLLLPIAASLILGACSGGDNEVPEKQPEAASNKPAASGMLAISAKEIARIGIRFVPADVAIEVPIATAPGSLAPPPNARIAVAAVIPGVVTRTLVVEGDTVRADQPLAVIAARELYTLGAGIEQAAARAEVARANDRRLGQLAREGVIAGARADEARATLREAEAELREQRRIVGLVNGAPGQGTYTLTAPISGKVTKASIQTGSPVSDATSAYVIDAVSQYELTVQLPERLLGQVHKGMAVRLPDDVRGTITSVGTVIDPQTRSATMRASITPGPGVVSGRAIPVTILAPSPSGAFLIPAAAVVEVGGKPSVFVRTPQGVAVRAVSVGDQADGKVLIRAGLKTGEQVAIAGMTELKAVAGQN